MEKKRREIIKYGKAPYLRGKKYPMNITDLAEAIQYNLKQRRSKRYSTKTIANVLFAYTKFFSEHLIRTGEEHETKTGLSFQAGIIAGKPGAPRTIHVQHSGIANSFTIKVKGNMMGIADEEDIAYAEMNKGNYSTGPAYAKDMLKKKICAAFTKKERALLLARFNRIPFDEPFSEIARCLAGEPPRENFTTPRLRRRR